MKKPRRFRVGRLFKRKSSEEVSAKTPPAEAPGEKASVSSEENQVELKMANEPVKTSETDIAALREEVELLELRVRKLQALEALQSHRVKRAAAKKS